MKADKGTNFDFSNPKDIKTLRNIIIDYSMVIFSIIGITALTIIILTLFRDGFTKPIELIVYITATTLLITATVFRKKLSLEVKIYLISLLILAVVVANFLGFGLIANAKVFIAVFPVFISFILPLKRSILVLMFFILVMAVFGVLYSQGILTYTIDTEEYATMLSSWIVGIIIILYLSVGLLFVGHFYSKALINNYQTIKQQNQLLIDKERKFRLLYETSNDAIVMIKDEKYVDFNDKTLELFQCSKEYLVNKAPWQLSQSHQPDGISSKEKAKNIFEKADKGEAQTFDWQHTRPDGSLFDVSISLNMINIDDSHYIQAVLRDITEKKLYEKELEVYRKRLENLVNERTQELEATNQELEAINEELTSTNDELYTQQKQLELTLNQLKETQKQLIQSEKMASLGILTSGIAHEINNPINFISSGVIGLEMEIKELMGSLQEYREISRKTLPESQQKMLNDIDQKHDIESAFNNIPRLIESIQTGIDRTIHIIRGLRTFSRMDSGEKSEANLHEIIDSTLTILHNKYKNRITIHKDYCQHGQIKCYPGKLGQLLLNLILNSIQAIEETGNIYITSQFEVKEKKYIIRIKDDGPGIPRENHSRVFDPFFTTKPVGQGTGLGLSISLGIVKDHGGMITFTSNTEKGTEFLVTLPES